MRDKRIQDELLLAALDRAERHSGREEPGVLLASFVPHLGLVHGSWTTRRIRPQLEDLQAAGLVEQLRRHSLVQWTLTTTGRKRLTAVPGVHSRLPESPQHKRWGEARNAASKRIDEFRETLGCSLDDARSLIDLDPRPQSDVWFELGKRLNWACWLVGSATYCLCEWAEPDDALADTDPDRPHGRRNVLRWPDR
jgi:hypothetical protein